MRGSVIVFLIFFVIQGLSAQDSKKTPLEGDKLENQFQYIITKTEKFQEYQVIKRSLLYKLKANTLDTIKNLHSEIATLNNKVSDLNSKLESVQVNLKETQDKLDTITKEKNSLRLLGMLVTKSAFYAIVISIILALIAALAIVFILYKRSNIITVKTKETLASTQEEFERHRKWALEKEQKLSRELLKEKQKNKGII